MIARGPRRPDLVSAQHPGALLLATGGLDVEAGVDLEAGFENGLPPALVPPAHPGEPFPHHREDAVGGDRAVFGDAVDQMLDVVLRDLVDGPALPPRQHLLVEIGFGPLPGPVALHLAIMLDELLGEILDRIGPGRLVIRLLMALLDGGIGTARHFLERCRGAGAGIGERERVGRPERELARLAAEAVADRPGSVAVRLDDQVQTGATAVRDFDPLVARLDVGDRDRR